MKKTTMSLLLFSVMAITAILSCSDDKNPATPPPDTSMSLLFNFLSADTIPDTLLYGQSLTAQLCVSDSDGGAPAVSISGIGSRFYIVSQTGDSMLVTFYLTGDSLQYDSLYSIVIRGDGGGIDTMSISIAMRVLDTNRLGGVRKPVVGMWWIEHQFDTMAFHLDSVDQGLLAVGDTQHVYITKYDTLVHHVYNIVTDRILISGDSVFRIRSFDTLKGEGAGGTDSIDQKTVFLKHTPTSFEIIMPAMAWLIDTLSYHYLTLPLSIGNSWPAVAISRDTGIRIWGIPLQAYLHWTGTNTVSSRIVRGFGGRDRTCYAINNVTDMSTVALLDTTLILPGGNDTLHPGDTLVRNTNHQTNGSKDNVCPDIGMTLCNHTIEAKLDTNFLEIKAARDTVWKGTFLQMLYDPRRGDTLIAQ